MFKKGKEYIFLLGVIIIFLGFGMFMVRNPIIEDRRSVEVMNNLLLGYYDPSYKVLPQ